MILSQLGGTCGLSNLQNSLITNFILCLSFKWTHSNLIVQLESLLVLNCLFNFFTFSRFFFRGFFFFADLGSFFKICRGFVSHFYSVFHRQLGNTRLFSVFFLTFQLVKHLPDVTGLSIFSFLLGQLPSTLLCFFCLLLLSLFFFFLLFLSLFSLQLLFFLSFFLGFLFLTFNPFFFCLSLGLLLFLPQFFGLFLFPDFLFSCIDFS